MAKRSQTDLAVRLVALALVTAALACIEAGAVICTRGALAPARSRHFPEAAREAVPLLSEEQRAQAGVGATSMLRFEQARELAGVLILAAMALGLRRWRGEGVALLLIALAAREAAYYALMRALTGWPGSLTAWDVLFRIPVPWVAPVWAPLAIAASMLAAGAIRLGRCARGLPATARVGPVAAIVLGSAAVVASFVARGSEAVGAVPAAFDWPWLLAGWLLGTAGLLWLAIRPRARKG